MSKIVENTKAQLKNIIMEAMGRCVSNETLPCVAVPAFNIEVPADNTHGDFAVNVAMVCAKAFRMPPFKIAAAIKDELDISDSYFEKFEIAGPGFINFFLNMNFYADVLKDINECGENYGRSNYGKNKKVMVEYISANPTGPMHMGNARGGALGDCLASVLDYAGYDVWREFYINDAGNQIDKFALSLEVRYLQKYLGEDAVELPEDSYHGEDIITRANEFAEIHGDSFVNASQEERRKALVDFALPKNIEKMQADLEKYRVKYDLWFKESILHNNGELKETIELMKEKGLTYEKENALWYRATEHGGEKDEVLIRQNGTPTYFAADIAYHRNKLTLRGFDKAIDVWGADHHGHVARLKGALEAIGIEPSRLDVVLMQLVRLTRGGEVVRMSKRTGKAITLNDLLDEIPADAARLLFNMREPGSQMDFDLDLAIEQSSQNPVFYVQYAHARICSIISKLQSEGVNVTSCEKENLILLNTSEEKELIRRLSELTEEVISAAKNYDPARITRYVLDLAGLFHKFYNACRVKGEEEKLMMARLQLCCAVRDTIKNVLAMMKISSPESM